MLGPYKEIKPQIYTTSVTWATYLHCTSLSCLWARQRSAQQKLYTTEPAQFILIAASLTCCQTSIILILIFHRLRNNSEGKSTPVPSDFIDQAQRTLHDSGGTCKKHTVCSLLRKFTIASAGGWDALDLATGSQSVWLRRLTPQRTAYPTVLQSSSLLPSRVRRCGFLPHQRQGSLRKKPPCQKTRVKKDYRCICVIVWQGS